MPSICRELRELLDLLCGAAHASEACVYVCWVCAGSALVDEEGAAAVAGVWWEERVLRVAGLADVRAGEWCVCGFDGCGGAA